MSNALHRATMAEIAAELRRRGLTAIPTAFITADQKQAMLDAAVNIVRSRVRQGWDFRSACTTPIDWTGGNA